jgi:hypothetical protein
MPSETMPVSSPEISFSANATTLSNHETSAQNQMQESANNRKVLACFLAAEDIEPKEKFVVWLATPPIERKPKTQAALAKLIGVNAVTLSKWKNSPDVASQVNSASRRYVSGRVSELIAAVFDDAVAGDRHSREMIFKYVLGWDDEKPAPVNLDNRFTVLIGGQPAPQLPIGIIGHDVMGTAGHVGLLPQPSPATTPAVESGGPNGT